MKVKNAILNESHFVICIYFQLCLPFCSSYTNALGLGFMNGQENIRLSDFINVAKDAETNTWSARSTTVLASTTGVLPRTTKEVTWKPFSAPGFSRMVKQSTTITGLTRRAKLRGEA